MRRRLLLCLLLAIGSHSICQGNDASDKRQSQRDGFTEFTLKQINPKNTDYGCELEVAHNFIVRNTVQTIDFWTALIALNFLVLSLVVILHQRREGNRREMIAAQFLSQYHNALVDARTHAVEAIRRCNAVVQKFNTVVEGSMRTQMHSVEAVETNSTQADAAANLEPKLNGIAHGENGVSTAASRTIAQHVRRDFKAGIPQNPEPKVDWPSQIRTLQQQLSASVEREKDLQRQLSKAQRQSKSEEHGDAHLAG